MENPSLENISLKTLLEASQKSISNYDYVVFTDGSGSTPDLAIGWAIFAFNTKTSEIIKQVGYFSNGTVNQAELLGISTFLQYLDAIKVTQGKLLVISDSEVTVKCGNGEYGRNANKGLWALLDYYKSVGFNVEFMWVKRNSNICSTWCDIESKEIRQRNKNGIL